MHVVRSVNLAYHRPIRLSGLTSLAKVRVCLVAQYTEPLLPPKDMRQTDREALHHSQPPLRTLRLSVKRLGRHPQSLFADCPGL